MCEARYPESIELSTALQDSPALIAPDTEQVAAGPEEPFTLSTVSLQFSEDCEAPITALFYSHDRALQLFDATSK
jgi:hypothetical protein